MRQIDEPHPRENALQPEHRTYAGWLFCETVLRKHLGKTYTDLREPRLLQPNIRPLDDVLFVYQNSPRSELLITYEDNRR